MQPKYLANFEVISIPHTSDPKYCKHYLITKRRVNIYPLNIFINMFLNHTKVLQILPNHKKIGSSLLASAQPELLGKQSLPFQHLAPQCPWWVWVPRDSWQYHTFHTLPSRPQGCLQPQTTTYIHIHWDDYTLWRYLEQVWRVRMGESDTRETDGQEMWKEDAER